MEITKGRVFLAERNRICGCKDAEKGKSLVGSRNSKNGHVAQAEKFARS